MKQLRNILAWPFMILGATLIFIGCAINADTINFDGVTLTNKETPKPDGKEHIG